MAKTLAVDVWSDIACPWCYVGKRRFEAALARFPHADAVRIAWHAFELDPSAPALRDPTQSYAERLSRKYGVALPQAKAMIARMVDTAAQDGIAMDFERIRSGNTFNAHRVLRLARERARQAPVMEAFMRGYLCDGMAIGESDSVLRMAVAGGLDADEVSGLLATDLYGAETRADEQEAKSLGIEGVPFFLLGRRYGVSGAQPAELLLGALQKAWDEAAHEEALGSAEGALCGPSGCA